MGGAKDLLSGCGNLGFRVEVRGMWLGMWTTGAKGLCNDRQVNPNAGVLQKHTLFLRGASVELGSLKVLSMGYGNIIPMLPVQYM